MEKRARGTFGPTAGSVYVLFVDDLNVCNFLHDDSGPFLWFESKLQMPQKEVYGAQPPIELLRQWTDYGGWYDRKERTFRRIVDTVLLAAMGPPGGGRNHITARMVRLQR
jgi:dynein heavy chain